jgi:hypothetical protein
MGRVLIVLILALAVGLYFPESRAMILERATPLRTPAYRWMTNQELNQIVNDLEGLQRSGGALPIQPGEFDLWLERRYPQENARQDAWGVRYRIEATPTGFGVRSAGPDGVFGTEDDLVREGERGPSQGPR